RGSGRHRCRARLLTRAASRRPQDQGEPEQRRGSMTLHPLVLATFEAMTIVIDPNPKSIVGMFQVGGFIFFESADSTVDRPAQAPGRLTLPLIRIIFRSGPKRSTIR